MTAPSDNPYDWTPPSDTSFVDLFKADVKPYVDQIKAAIAELVDLIRPEVDPPICRQHIEDDPRGTE